MSIDPRSVLRWASLAASIGVALYGIIVRGRTVHQRRRQRAYAFFGTGLALGNSLWDHVGLSDGAALAMSVVGTVVLVIGIALLVKSQYESTAPGGSSAT